MAGPPSDLDAIRRSVVANYPALAPHMDNTAIQWGGPEQQISPEQQLEYYGPETIGNPNPGRSTLELYNPRMQGKALESAVAGDMLHKLGSTEYGKPVDPYWRSMRQKVIDARDPSQIAMDEDAYKQDQNIPGYLEMRSPQGWMDQSRADAYVRGKLTPDVSDQWKDTYNPAQEALLSQMNTYLRTKPTPLRDVPPSATMNQITSRGIWE